ncbi:MAG: hypothetical protein ACLFUF_05250 [Opitutales bacterium]
MSDVNPEEVRLEFGAESSGYSLRNKCLWLHVGLPCLSMPACGLVFRKGIRVSFESERVLFGEAGSSGLLFGFLQGEGGTSLSAEVETLYRRMLEYTAGAHLVRAWNIIPGINRSDSGEPRYWRFNRGRQRAFEGFFAGEDWRKRLPAASAVGGATDQPATVFFLAAKTATPAHHENPRQVPAYRYPGEYGPEAPGFARCTTVRLAGDAGAPVFAAGTSAVVGHESVGAGDFDAQVQAAWENLSVLSGALGFDGVFHSDTPARRIFIAYLRRVNDLHAARSFLESKLDPDTDRLVCLQADICRPELDFEVEVTCLPREWVT